MIEHVAIKRQRRKSINKTNGKSTNKTKGQKKLMQIGTRITNSSMWMGRIWNRGVYNWAAFDFIPPLCLWFSSPRRVASRYKIFDFLPLKAIKQYILGLNSVKLCCSNCILPFGTTKSFLFSFFQTFDFLPHLQTLWFYSPPHGGKTQLYTRL